MPVVDIEAVILWQSAQLQMNVVIRPGAVRGCVVLLAFHSPWGLFKVRRS